MPAEPKLKVLCVDDNAHVVEAVRLKLARMPAFEWVGALSNAENLTEAVAGKAADVVILDVDMPGVEPVDALAALARQCPRVRTIVFSGHVQKDLIERAVDAGAWGYVYKGDGDEELVAALERVASGHFAFSPEARSAFDAT